MESLPTFLSQFQNEVNRLLERNQAWGNSDLSKVATTQWSPAVDIKEEDNQFLIVADIPGVDPKDIHVTMEKGLLTIHGERKTEKEAKGENYYRVERSSGVFYRRFSLPDSADNEKINAKSKHGVLEIVIPKRQQSQTRKVDVAVQG